MRRILLVLQLIILLSCNKKAEDAMILIPENFVGPVPVLIIFDSKTGVKKEYNDGKRVYRIPENGILETQFSPSFGIARNDFYYEGNSGTRKRIESNRKKPLNVSEAVVFGIQTVGSTRRLDPDTDELLYKTPHGLSFYIGVIVSTEEAHRAIQRFVMDNMKRIK